MLTRLANNTWCVAANTMTKKSSEENVLILLAVVIGMLLVCCIAGLVVLDIWVNPAPPPGPAAVYNNKTVQFLYAGSASTPQCLAATSPVTVANCGTASTAWTAAALPNDPGYPGYYNPRFALQNGTSCLNVTNYSQGSASMMMASCPPLDHGMTDANSNYLWDIQGTASGASWYLINVNDDTKTDGNTQYARRLYTNINSNNIAHAALSDSGTLAGMFIVSTLAPATSTSG